MEALWIIAAFKICSPDSYSRNLAGFRVYFFMNSVSLLAGIWIATTEFSAYDSNQHFYQEHESYST